METADVVNSVGITRDNVLIEFFLRGLLAAERDSHWRVYGLFLVAVEALAPTPLDTLSFYAPRT